MLIGRLGWEKIDLTGLSHLAAMLIDIRFHDNCNFLDVSLQFSSEIFYVSFYILNFQVLDSVYFYMLR